MTNKVRLGLLSVMWWRLYKTLKETTTKLSEEKKKNEKW